MKIKWIAVITAVLMLVGNLGVLAVGFDDVGEAHAWAKVEIENYAQRGILAGDGKGNFMPDDNVTRAEFAKMLCLVFGLESAEELKYGDVDKDSWQYDYIAKTDAYTFSPSSDTYEPDKAATRAEIAYAIVNAAGFDVKEAQMPFTDIDETDTALLANVKTAYALGILKGYPDNTFRPNASVTRAEAVVLLSRAEAILNVPPIQDEPEEEQQPAEPPKEEPVKENIRIEPMDTLCYVESVSERLDPKKEEELAYCVRFCVSGSETLYELYIDKDVPIYSVNGAVSTIQRGDIICINTNLYGTVKEVYILLRMGTAPILSGVTASENAFLSKLNVPTAHKWGRWESDAKYEVHLGFLGDLEYDGAEAKLWIYPSDGNRKSDKTYVLNVAEDANVITYNTNSRSKTPYGFETIETLEYYGAPKDNYGNIVTDTTKDWQYHQYVFVRAKNGVVTDLLVISNQ